MSYVIALLVVIVGSCMVVKTEWFLSTFGRIGWAEEHLGYEGGSRLAYKILGLTAIFLAILGATGALGEMIIAFFGPLFGATR